MELLESRWMMSADLAPVELPLADITPWPAVPAVVADLDVPRRELVVIDGGLPDIETLVAGITGDAVRQVEIVILAPDADGFAQVTELLFHRDDLDALHIISHGRAGALQLGDVTLDADALDVRAAALTKWHRAFRAGADILLYGCDLAGNPDGVRFVETLGALAGADVAASDDATGSATLGGDWMLEFRSGTLETALVVDAQARLAYDGLLALQAADSFVNSGNLDGNTSGAGWGDAWSVDTAKMRSNGADLSDPTDLLATSGSSAVATLTTASSSVTAIRNLDAAVGVDGTTTWIGFLVEPGSTDAGAAMGLEFGNAAGDVAFAGFDGTSFVLQKSDGTGQVTVGGLAASAGDAAFVVLKIDSVAGNDTITMYVNPTPGVPSPVTAFTVVKSNLDLGAFTRIGITSARGTAANAAMLDEIRVGTSYSDIAPTLVVTTATDTNTSGIVDGNAAHTIAWLHANQGPFVSLREAIIAANNTAGADTIQFDIDGAGPHTITLASALPAITGAVTIDGTSEPDYAGSPVIILRGSAIAGPAIGLDLQSSNNAILGITIREFAGAGIRVVSSSTGNMIGDNIITANTGAGVALASPGAQAAILNNLIHANGGQGIDLNADTGVAANDFGDGDAGANGLLNFPVIHGVALSGGVVTITGEAVAGALVEFFESTNDGNGHGEGVSVIGFGTVGATGTPGTADATAIQFSFSFAQGTLVLGDTVTATATLSSAITSEFSANVAVAAPTIAPVVTLPGTSATFTEGGADVALDATLTITDGDSTHLVAAVVAITGGYRSTEDFLLFTDQLGITGVWDAASGTLTLTGTANVADYRTALRSVTYRNTSDAPGVAARTIAFSVSDSTGSSAPVTTSLAVVADNDAPAMTVPGTQTVLEDTDLVFLAALGNAITISDPDAGMDGAQVELTATSGTLHLSGTTGIAFGSGADGTASMAIAGTVADLNAALNGLVFRPAANATAGVTLRFFAYDFGNYGLGGPKSDTEVVTVTITPVNDVPVVSANTGATLTEGGTIVLSAGQLAATDIEDTASQLRYVVQVLPVHGSLRRSGMVLDVGEHFTQADIAAGLVSYVHDGADTTADAFGFDLLDADLAGPVANTFAFTVTPVDDPIVLSGARLTVPAGGAVVLSTGAFTVADPDGPAGPISFTVRNVTGGAFERTAAAGTAITTFSAAEIVAGDIRFVADGSSTVPAFEVSATDGVETTAFLGATVTLTGTLDTTLLAAASSTPVPTVTVSPGILSPVTPATDSAAADAIEPDAQVEESTADRPPVPMAVPRQTPSRSARPAAESAGAEADAARAAATQSEGARPPGAAVGGVTAIAPLVLGPSSATTPLTALPTAPGTAPVPVAGPVDAANLTMDSEALAAAQTALGNTEWRGALEKAKAETVAQGRVEALVVGSSTAVAGSLSVGYVMWLVRGGVLLSSLMSSLPAWRVLDPLPILGRSRNDEEGTDADESDGEGPDDPLERLFMRARSALGRGAESQASVAEAPK